MIVGGVAKPKKKKVVAMVKPKKKKAVVSRAVVKKRAVPRAVPRAVRRPLRPPCPIPHPRPPCPEPYFPQCHERYYPNQVEPYECNLDLPPPIPCPPRPIPCPPPPPIFHSPIIVPAGFRCLPTLILIKLGLRHEAYPFDWAVSSPDKIAYAITDNLVSMFRATDVPPSFLAPYPIPTPLQLSTITNSYGMALPHVLNSRSAIAPQIPPAVATMQRRNHRLLMALAGTRPVIFFIYYERPLPYNLTLLRNVINLRYPRLTYRILVITNTGQAVDRVETGLHSISVFGNYPVCDGRDMILPSINPMVVAKIRNLLLG